MVGVAEVDQGLRLPPGHVNVPGHVELEEALEDVFQEVGGNDGGEVPVQFGQQQEFPFLKQENKLIHCRPRNLNNLE